MDFKELLLTTKNEIAIIRHKIKEIEYIIENISEKLQILESTENNQLINENNKPIENKKTIKIITEPSITKKNKKIKRKHPGHEMYKYVVPIQKQVSK